MSLRVVHVVPTYYPATRYGGPIHSVHGLCRAQARCGFDVQVLTTNVDGRGKLPVPLATPIDRGGVSVRYFPTLWRRLYWSPRMGQVLGEFIRGCDIVHLHSVFLWPTMAAAAAARAAGVPYVMSPRGMLERGLIDQKNPVAKKIWIRLFEARNLRHAGRIHVTSEREMEELRALDLCHGRYALVPNGVDEEHVRLAPFVARVSNRVLYLGRLSWKKGLNELIEALALIDDATLTVVGPDDEGQQLRLEQRARQLGIRDRIVFKSAVSGQDKWWLLDEAALLVLPSRSENFGIVVIEALARGLPVVLSRDVGVADEVVKAGAGVVSATDPESLAATIQDLLQSPERRQRMGEIGHQLVQERFTWSRVAAQMEEVYRALVQDRAVA